MLRSKIGLVKDQSLVISKYLETRLVRRRGLNQPFSTISIQLKSSAHTAPKSSFSLGEYSFLPFGLTWLKTAQDRPKSAQERSSNRSSETEGPFSHIDDLITANSRRDNSIIPQQFKKSTWQSPGGVMAKRFTDTGKWDKSWFRKLGSKLRDIRQYVLDRCDHAGLIEIDLETFEHFIGDMVHR